MTLKNEKHYNAIVEMQDGTVYKIHANQMHNLDMDFWQGWECAAGYDRISIDVDGTVWSGACRNDKLGTLKNWSLLEKPTICKQKRCNGCTDDLMISKKNVS